MLRVATCRWHPQIFRLGVGSRRWTALSCARATGANAAPACAVMPGAVAAAGAGAAAAILANQRRAGATAAAAEVPKANHRDDDLLKRLRMLDCCAICDGSGKAARVVSTVKPLRSGYRMAGRARTVRIDGDFLEVLYAIRGASPGDVLMIDAGFRGTDEDRQWPRAGGMFGELLSHEAQRRGVAGMVIDGNCRDTPILLQMNLPVFSRGRHPNAGTACRRGTNQCAVQMGGVSVLPGEYVLGDDDGVVVMSREELEQWLPRAEDIQRVEAAMLLHVQRGGSLFDKLPNFDDHVSAVSDGDLSSRLRFS